MWVQVGELRDRTGLLLGALDAYDRAAEAPPRRSCRAGARLLLRRAHTHERAGLIVVPRVAARGRTVLEFVDGVATAQVRAEALAIEALLRQRQERPREPALSR